MLFDIGWPYSLICKASGLVQDLSYEQSKRNSEYGPSRIWELSIEQLDIFFTLRGIDVSLLRFLSSRTRLSIYAASMRVMSVLHLSGIGTLEVPVRELAAEVRPAD